MIPTEIQSSIGTFDAQVIEVVGERALAKHDYLAVEQPLDIRIGFGPGNNRDRKTISITMRTPGHDGELAVGLLFAEGVLTQPSDVLRIVQREPNVVRVDLSPGVRVDLAKLQRSGVMNSSCGLCGKTTIDGIEESCEMIPSGGATIPAAVIHKLPSRLREVQPTFAQTGGLHAVALFNNQGDLLTAREDVGRHNAADKLIGSECLAGRLPLAERILFVSGRASFELVQKAIMAGVPVFAAVGAPSSLAVELATRFGMTLLGFVRDGRFNIYCGAERIGVELDA